MKVAHLATSRRGGAAVAAMRIVEAQVHVGIDAVLLIRGRGQPDSDHVHSGESLPVGLPQAVTSRALTLLNQAVTRKPSVLFTPFSSSSRINELQSAIPAGDVVNLHNTYNMVSLRRVLQAFPRSCVVATLHDERLLTAGCHATLGCDLFEKDCEGCPQSHWPRVAPLRHRQSRQRALIDAARVHVVAPSLWIQSQALKLGIEASRVHHVPNPINTEIFTEPSSRADSSGLHLTIGWLPGKLEEEFWQGVRLAQRELEERSLGYRIQVLTVEDAKIPTDVPVERIAGMETELERARFWQQSDVAVSITNADNFPNVALEAIACGTPLIISDVGGAAEVVKGTGGGLALSNNSPETIAAAILDMCLHRTFWRSRGSEAAEAARFLYSYDRIGRLYESMYEACIRETRLYLGD